MAGRYRLTVLVHDKWVAAFQKNGMNLCATFGVQSGKQIRVDTCSYNIVSWAEKPTPINTLAWTDEYYIAACKSGLSEGTWATPNTYPQRMNPADTLKLASDWSISRTSAPASTILDHAKSAFHFNNTIAASVMLFKRIQARITPVFLLSMGPWPLIPGNYNLVPAETVSFFFAPREAGVEGLTDGVGGVEGELPTGAVTIRYAEQKDARLIYTEEGSWAVEMPTDDNSDGVVDEAWERGKL